MGSCCPLTRRPLAISADSASTMRSRTIRRCMATIHAFILRHVDCWPSNTYCMDQSCGRRALAMTLIAKPVSLTQAMWRGSLCNVPIAEKAAVRAVPKGRRSLFGMGGGIPPSPRGRSAASLRRDDPMWPSKRSRLSVRPDRTRSGRVLDDRRSDGRASFAPKTLRFDERPDQTL